MIDRAVGIVLAFRIVVKAHTCMQLNPKDVTTRLTHSSLPNPPARRSTVSEREEAAT